jgi:hypothetical protein
MAVPIQDYLFALDKYRKRHRDEMLEAILFNEWSDKDYTQLKRDIYSSDRMAAIELRRANLMSQSDREKKRNCSIYRSELAKIFLLCNDAVKMFNQAFPEKKIIFDFARDDN